jgi:hypothetical protein
MSPNIDGEKPTVQPWENLVQSETVDKIDTLHNDEALKVIAEEHGSNEWDSAEEKRLVRKIDRCLLPLLCLT